MAVQTSSHRIKTKTFIEEITTQELLKDFECNNTQFNSRPKNNFLQEFNDISFNFDVSHFLVDYDSSITKSEIVIKANETIADFSQKFNDPINLRADFQSLLPPNSKENLSLDDFQLSQEWQLEWNFDNLVNNSKKDLQAKPIMHIPSLSNLLKVNDTIEEKEENLSLQNSTQLISFLTMLCESTIQETYLTNEKGCSVKVLGVDILDKAYLEKLDGGQRLSYILQFDFKYFYESNTSSISQLMTALNAGLNDESSNIKESLSVEHLFDLLQYSFQHSVNRIEQWRTLTIRRNLSYLCAFHTKLLAILENSEITPPPFPDTYHFGILEESFHEIKSTLKKRNSIIQQYYSQITSPSKDSMFSFYSTSSSTTTSEFKSSSSSTVQSAIDNVSAQLQEYFSSLLLLFHDIYELFHNNSNEFDPLYVVHKKLHSLFLELFLVSDIDNLLSTKSEKLLPQGYSSNSTNLPNISLPFFYYHLPRIHSNYLTNEWYFHWKHFIENNILLHTKHELDLLKIQRYQCFHCQEKITMQYLGLEKNFSYCTMFQGLFCTRWCHQGDIRPIPNRILHCWDCRKYPVSRLAAQIIDSIWTKPLFHFKDLNALLIEGVPNLQQIMFLRQKLTKFFFYFFQQQQHQAKIIPSNSEFEIQKQSPQKQTSPSRYMEELYHLIITILGKERVYLIFSNGLHSLDDFLAIQSGKLNSMLVQLMSKLLVFQNNYFKKAQL